MSNLYSSVVSGYNVRVIFYNNEIQIEKYEIPVAVTATHNMTDEEKEIFKNENDITDYQQRSKLLTDDVADYSELNKKRSVRRSKQSIYQLARSNDWDYFATFTFSSDYRYNFDECRRVFQKFMNNFKNRIRKIEYLAIAEKHKDGAWHYHALIQGDLSDIAVAGIRPGTLTLTQYRKIGRNELELVRDTHKVSNYITKYITKDLIENLNHKRRYLCSRGLKRPEIKEFRIDENLDIATFIMSNFPEYSASYNKIVEKGGHKINYIQLKKDKPEDLASDKVYYS